MSVRRKGKNYAMRTDKVFLHRILLGFPAEESDHVNGDGLDNRRCNLRAATHSQNNCNKPAQSRNTSGYKGVSQRKDTGRWDARVTMQGRQVCLGSFDTPEKAAEAYDKAALELQGEFARPNSGRL